MSDMTVGNGERAVHVREKLYRKLMSNPEVRGVGVNMTADGKDVIVVYVVKDVSQKTLLSIPRKEKGVPIIIDKAQ